MARFLLHTILHQLFARLLITQNRIFTCYHESGRHNAALSRQHFRVPRRPTSLLHIVPSRTRIVSAATPAYQEHHQEANAEHNHSCNSPENQVTAAKLVVRRLRHNILVPCKFRHRNNSTNYYACVREKSSATHHQHQHLEDLLQRDNCCSPPQSAYYKPS